MFEHVHATRVWETVNISNSGALELVLMVETSLPLDPLDANFDDESYAGLSAAVAAYISFSEHFDRAMLVPQQTASPLGRAPYNSHHLAGWRFSINEESQVGENMVNVIDVHLSNYHEAKKWALQQFTVGSDVIASFPLSEEMVGGRGIRSVSEKWIPLRNSIPESAPVNPLSSEPAAHRNIDQFSLSN